MATTNEDYRTIGIMMGKTANVFSLAITVAASLAFVSLDLTEWGTLIEVAIAVLAFPIVQAVAWVVVFLVQLAALFLIALVADKKTGAK